MNYEDIIWDIREIVKAIEDDSDLSDFWLINKINNYRQIHILNDYNLNNYINPAWLQRIYKFKWEKVTAADDPNITYSSVILGRHIFPALINLPEDLGLYRLSGSSNIDNFEYTSIFNLMLLSKMDASNRNYGYYTRIGNYVYITPHVPEGTAIVIAANPMEIQVNDEGTLRDRKISDECPIDGYNAQKIIIDILTNDLRINLSILGDYLNDAEDNLKVLKNTNVSNK